MTGKVLSRFLKLVSIFLPVLAMVFKRAPLVVKLMLICSGCVQVGADRGRIVWPEKDHSVGPYQFQDPFQCVSADCDQTVTSSVTTQPGPPRPEDPFQCQCRHAPRARKHMWWLSDHGAAPQRTGADSDAARSHKNGPHTKYRRHAIHREDGQRSGPQPPAGNKEVTVQIG